MSISPADKRSLMICAIFLTAVFGYLYVVDPMLATYGQVEEQIASINQKAYSWNNERKMLGFRRRMDELTQNELTRWINAKQVRLFEGQRITQSMADFESAARISTVNLTDIRPLSLTTDPKSNFEQANFSLSFSGKREEVLRTLYLIETAPALQGITSASLTAKENGIDVRLEVVRKFLAEKEQHSPSAEEREIAARVFSIATPQRVESGSLFIAYEKGYLAHTKTKFNLLLANSGMVENWLRDEEEVNAVAIEGAPFLTNAVIPAQIIPVYMLCTSSIAVGLITDVKSGIRSVGDLKGKTIAVDPHTFQMMSLVKTLVEHGMKSNDIAIVQLAQDEAIAAIRSKLLSAGVVNQPWLSRAEEDGRTKTLFTLKPSFPLDTFFLAIGPEHFGNDTAGENVLHLLNAVWKAQCFWAANPEQGDKIVARYIGCNVAQVSQWRKEMVFYSPQENAQQLQKWEAAVDSQKNMDLLERYVEAWGMGNVVINPGRRIDTTLVRKISTAGAGVTSND